MNKNIEIITPELWAVHSEWIRAGYIKELKPIPKKIIEQISITENGIMVLDKSSKVYPALKKLFPIVQKMDREQLQSILEHNQNKKDMDSLDDLWVNVVGWELARRQFKKAYSDKFSKPAISEKIKQLFGKAGEKYGNNSNSD